MPMSSMHTVRIGKNRLRGALPESVGSWSTAIEVLTDTCRLNGTLPGSLTMLSSLRAFDISTNRITGTIPASLGSLIAMERLDLGQNRLWGSIPDCLAFPSALARLGLASNKFSQSLPVALEHLSCIEILFLEQNGHIWGSLPVGMRLLSKLDVSRNRLAGTLPEALGASQRLVWLGLSSNVFLGTFPDGVVLLDHLTSLSVSDNKISLTFPEGIGSIQGMDSIYMDENNLRGTVPENWMRMRRLRRFYIRSNSFTGTIPEGLRFLSAIAEVGMSSNGLRGRIPGAWGTWKLKLVLLCGNSLAGSLPSDLFSKRYINNLDLGKNLLEGTVPVGIGKLTELVFLGMAGAGQSHGVLHGHFPASLARAHRLWRFLWANHRMAGPVPSFTSTLAVLTLYQNLLQLMPGRLRLFDNSTILLHSNRLSCQLPSQQKSAPKHGMALVAIGNHLTAGRHYPPWVMPMERDGLFWVDNTVVFWLLLKICIGIGSLAAAITLRKPASAAAIVLTAPGGVAPLFRAAYALLAFMVSHGLSSCLLLMFVGQDDDQQHLGWYACPATLAFASGCLWRSSSVQTMVGIQWGRQLVHTGRWMHGRRTAERAVLETTWKHCVAWTLWLCLVLVMSTFAAVDASHMCMPSSWISLSGHAVKVLHLATGGCQAILSGALVPSVAAKFSPARKPALVSVASLVHCCLIPGLVVLHLDVECWDHWTSYWAPCLNERDTQFNLAMARLDQRGLVSTPILHRSDICAPHPLTSPARCARSIALKLQGVLLNKLTMSALLFPSARLLCLRVYRGTEAWLTKLTFLVVLGVLLGAALPLLAPLLCMGILGETYVALFSTGIASMNSDCDEGDMRVAVFTAGVISVLFHCSFFSDAVSSIVALCASSFLAVFVVTWLVVGKLRSHATPLPTS